MEKYPEMPHVPERDLHNALVTIPEAYQILWKAGNMALSANKDNEHINAITADFFGELFSKLDYIREEAEVISPALPEGEVPRFSFRELMPAIDPVDYKNAFQDGPTNPFEINDDKYLASENTALYLQAAYNELSGGE